MKTSSIAFYPMFVLGLTILAPLLQFGQQDWRDAIGDPTVPFEIAQQMAYDYFENNPDQIEAEGSGWKQFKRWESFWEGRVDENGLRAGGIEKLHEVIADYEDWCDASNQIPVTWNSLGPHAAPERIVANSDYGSPGVGMMLSIWVDPDNFDHILGGSSSGGLWETMDAGASWTNITDGFGYGTFGVHSVSVAEQNKDHIYIGTGVETGVTGMDKEYGWGVLRSLDGGVTWDITGLTYYAGEDETPPTWKVVADPFDTDGNIVYAATDAKVYKSTNAGGTFTPILEASDDVKFKDFDIKPDNPAVLIASAANGAPLWANDIPGSIWRSTDGGATWSNLTSELGGAQNPSTYNLIFTEFSPVDPNIVYCLGRVISSTNTEYFDVFRSEDAGLTWVQMADDINMLAAGALKGDLRCSAVNSDIIYMSAVEVFRSINQGQSFYSISDWNQMNVIDYMHADIRDMAIMPFGSDDLLFAAHDGGVGRRIFGQQSSWTDLSSGGLTVGQIYGMSSSNSDRVYCGFQDLSTQFFQDGEWFNTGAGDGGNCLVNFVDNNEALMSVNQKINRTFNNGVTFAGLNFGTGIHHDLPFTYNSQNPEIRWAAKPDVRRLDFDDVQINWTWTQLMDPQISGLSQMTRPQTIASSKTNPNILVVADGRNPWSDDFVILKTSDALVSNGFAQWEDLTDQLSEAGCSAKIEEVLINPEDEDDILLAMQKFNDGEKIYRSYDGGQTFVNISYNLPNTPVNCIEYQENSDGTIYIGTDVGVFYTNNSLLQTQTWKCLTGNMPLMMIADLEINYCTGKLLAASFGRGLWDCDLITESTELIVDQDATWDYPRAAISDIRVTSGNELVIKDLINMPKESKIIVEPGAKLIIDGGHITNKCGELWRGIEVWGDESGQQLSSVQGTLEIINGGKIEHAKCAIRLGRIASTDPVVYDWSKTGGIVTARSGSMFLNNAKGVEFLTYQNMLSSGEIGNVSSFSNCTFEVNDDNRFDDNHDSFISMWKVKGVRIRGCSFANNMSTDVPWSQRGVGLYTSLASYYVYDYCVNNQYECDEAFQIHNSFTGLNFAIRSSGAIKLHPVRIDHSLFDNNRYGVLLSGLHNAQVTRNDFIWNQPDGSTFGLYLSECNGYEVEENLFDGSDSGASFGVVVNNSGPYSNFVYNNDFQNNYIACLVQGNNQAPDNDLVGLQFRCNRFGSNSDPDLANTYAIGLSSGASIAEYQGILGLEIEAGNRFWPECDPIVNVGSESSEIRLTDASEPSLFDYIHHHDVLSPETVPECHSDGVGLWSTTQAFSLDQCPVNISFHEVKELVEDEMQEHHDAYTSLRAAYDGYINNGTGPTLRSLVDDPSVESLELRNALLDASPKVDDRILVDAMNRTPEMTGWHMAQVLLENSPLKQSVIREMELRGYEPFYEELVLQGQNGGINTRNLMEMDYSWFNSERDRRADDLVRVIAKSDSAGSAWPEIQALMASHSYFADELETILFFLDNGDNAQAGSALATCDNQDGYCDLLDIQYDIATNGIDSNDLSTGQIASLDLLALNPDHPNNSTSQLILEFWGHGWYDAPLADIGNQPRSFGSRNSELNGEISRMSIHPNPSSGNVYAQYQLPEDYEALLLRVFDLNGKLILETRPSSSGITELNSQNFDNGIYTAILLVDGIHYEEFRFEIIK